MQTIEECAEGLAAGTMTSRALVEACLARIEEPNSEGSRAFIKVHAEQARAMADAMDALRRVGRAPSRYAGIPVSLKDLFDIAGEPTPAGSRVLADAPPATAHATVVQRMLAAGFVPMGRTNMTEFAFSGLGINPHYGTPRSPWDRESARIPGGSSSGTAVSVSDGMAVAGLGTDTGGSCRIPAAFCGIVGYKPTARRVPITGVLPLAPSLDTVGWFARDASLLATVGEVLLPGDRSSVGGPLLRVEEAWVNAQPEVAEVLRPQLERLEQLRGRAVGVRLAPEGIDSFYDHFRVVQAEEAWTVLGDWIETTQPRLGPGVAERIAGARATDAAAAAPGRAFRRVLQARIRPLLAGGAVLVYPTSPCPAPLLTAAAAEQEAIRQATVGVTAIASLCGLPEVSLPAATVRGAPVGLSFVAAAGRDTGLLAFAREAAGALGLPT